MTIEWRTSESNDASNEVSNQNRLRTFGYDSEFYIHTRINFYFTTILNTDAIWRFPANCGNWWSGEVLTTASVRNQMAFPLLAFGLHADFRNHDSWKFTMDGFDFKPHMAMCWEQAVTIFEYHDYKSHTSSCSGMLLWQEVEIFTFSMVLWGTSQILEGRWSKLEVLLKGITSYLKQYRLYFYSP